ncbi:F-box/kelch-repeat protein At3g06240 [Prunus persica]|uniref:F-box/kelch-repeat protein At3g06240 n=1 Tax=Prunus persica TaxID=3760 RepID=UPI0002C29F01|nr:F-box/kelch-repeat protein At3g06240 [Prunus persica]
MAMEKTTLPDDIIVEILLKLPMESLIRFSCVSKRWRYLVISDPEFAQHHFKLGSKHKTLKRRLLFSSTSSKYPYELNWPEHLFGSVDLEGDSPVISKLVSPFKQGNGAIILGSCNGLVCAQFQEKFYICNPSTGLSNTLCNSGFLEYFRSKANGRRRRVEMSPIYHGFGYVSATDDYKLVVAIGCFHRNVEVAIFSLRDNVWKWVKAPRDYSNYGMVSPHGALLNEALHWFYNPRQNEQCICAFDLAKEEFRVMPLPVLSEADKFDLRFQYLGVLEGCLSLSGWKSQGSIEIWVMKEYGLRESWNHLFKFDIVCYVPVLVSKSGNIVVKQIWSNDMAVYEWPWAL